MGTVIGFVNEKGGSGKSTSAVHFACWLRAQGSTVLLVDADTQVSSSEWLKSMDNSLPYQVLNQPDDLLESLPELATGCEYLVVDGPAGLSEATRAILFRTDLAIVPCQPTGLDLRSASNAVRLIRQAQSVRTGPPKAALFLNRAIKGTKLKDEALQLLGNFPELRLLHTVIHQKQAIADASGQGTTVWDLPGRPAAESAREYQRLFKEILGLLP